MVKDLETLYAESKQQISYYQDRALKAETTSTDLRAERDAAIRRAEAITLHVFRDLEKGWDSYGGAKISEKAILVAESILNTKVQAVPCSTGGIQIEWHCGGVDVEFSILPDGTIEDEVADLEKTISAQAEEIRVLREALDELYDPLMRIGLLSTGWKYGNEGVHLLRIENIIRAALAATPQPAPATAPTAVDRG